MAGHGARADHDAAAARVVIAGAHPVIREVVRRSCMTEGGLEIVAEVTDADGLLEACRREHPDVIVLDVELDDGDGLEALRAIREEGVAAGCSC